MHFSDASFWNKHAQDQLKSILNRPLNTNVAKNVILFLGDGMGIPTITAARIYKGQLKGHTGEEEELVFEKFPYTGLSKVSHYSQYSLWLLREVCK